jgi:hypothetical protein
MKPAKLVPEIPEMRDQARTGSSALARRFRLGRRPLRAVKRGAFFDVLTPTERISICSDLREIHELLTQLFEQNARAEKLPFVDTSYSSTASTNILIAPDFSRL